MRKFIDEKGRLGSKCSVIDLAVLLLILVVVAGAVFAFMGEAQVEGADGTVVGRDMSVRYTLQISGVRDWALHNIRVGDQLFVGETDVGTIISRESEPYKMLFSEDGEVWWAEVPDRHVIIIQVEGTATVLDGRILVAGTVPMSVSNTTMGFTSRYADFHATTREFDFYEES